MIRPKGVGKGAGQTVQTFTVNDPSVFLFIHQRPDRSTRREFSPNCICQSAFLGRVFPLSLRHFHSFSLSSFLLGLTFKVHHLFSLLCYFALEFRLCKVKFFGGVPREVHLPMVYGLCLGRSHNALSSGYLCFGL